MVNKSDAYKVFIEARKALLKSISEDESAVSREYYRSKARPLNESEVMVIHGVADKLHGCSVTNRTLSKEDMFALAKKLYGISLIGSDKNYSQPVSDKASVLSPKKQLHYNIGVCWKAVILLRRGMAGCGRAVFQEIGVDMHKCLSLLIAMSRENNERLWQTLCAVMAICLGMIGWYASEISSDLRKANDGITSLAVQVARVEARVDGIEKRLDTRVAFEPSKSDMMVAATR